MSGPFSSLSDSSAEHSPAAPRNLPTGAPPADQTLARLDAVASGYLAALRAGEDCSLENLCQRHPDLADSILQLFPCIAALEDWKSERELAEPEPQVGDVTAFAQLGRYRIVREIGRGGMGVVYEAEEASAGRRVAVKRLSRRFARTSRWRKQFAREARIVAALSHPHIVPVFTYGEDRGHSYFVMQLIEGIGLDRLIGKFASGQTTVSAAEISQSFQGQSDQARASPSTSASQRVLRRRAWPQLARIGLQACSALKFAHGQGTLHRDIKPANLLIDVQGNVWMADFGLAVSMDQAWLAGRAPLVGTLRYMAPEQFDGQFDSRSDLYSLGATLYELCTLQPAFSGLDRDAVVQSILRGRPVAPADIASDIPASLERTILKALHRDPDQRYQSAEEFRQALLNVSSPRRSPLGKRLWNWAMQSLGPQQRKPR